MNKFIAFLFPLLMLSCSTPAPSPKEPVMSPAEVETIANQLIQGAFDDIWSALQEESIADYHTDDFILLENGELWTNETIIDYQNRTRQNEERPVRKNSMDFIKAELAGESIWMAYHNYATFFKEEEEVGKAEWLESAVAIKTEKGWRLKMMHSTYVPQND